MNKSLLGLPVLLLCALAAACGGSDQNSSNSGGNGGAGANGNGGSGADGGAQQGGGGAGGDNTGGGATGGGDQGGGDQGGGNQGGGGSGGGTGGPCGGIAGTPCSSNAYCDFPDNGCGAADGAGTCTPKPEGCPDIYDPVCACDGTVYSNACDAAAAGHDVSLAGGCAPPKGYFPCGAGFCTQGEQYCQVQVSDVAGVPDTYSCIELPPNCKTEDAICSCLSDVECGQYCKQENGDFTLICPGG